MKRTKAIISVILILCLTICYTGCDSNHDKGSLKDNLIDGWDNWMQSFSKYALTKDKDLQGNKTKGGDAYVGSYSAVYEKFYGEEYLFGGTGLERKAGNNLVATYILNITSGTANLNWVHSGSEYTITNVEGEDTFNITIGSGDSYIVLKGSNFTGSLELVVKDTKA